MSMDDECNIQNYTQIRQSILYVDIGLYWSAAKLYALWEKKWFIITTSGLCFAMCFFILILNSLVLRHYIKKYKQLIPLLYTSMSLCDIGNAISAFLTGALLLMIMCNYRSHSDPYPTMTFMVKLTYILFSLTSRVSIFFNTVLVVIRTINVVFPTYTIKRSRVIVVLVVGSVLWLSVAAIDIVGLQQILPYFAKIKSETNEIPSTQYDVLVDSLVVNPLTGFFFIYYIFDKMCNIHNFNIIGVYVLVKGVPFVLPSAISIACMVIQTYYLIIRSRVGRHSAVSRRITITVLYLTTVFVACNIPDFVLNLMCLGVISISTDHLPTYMCATFVSSVMLPFVNSLFNPFILLIRGSTLKKSVQSCFCGPDSFRFNRGKASGLGDFSREKFDLWKRRSDGNRMIRRNDNTSLSRMDK